MRIYYLFVLVAAIACLVPHQADAGIVIYGTHTDHGIVPGGSLSDVRMTVDLSVTGGVATMTFTNTSGGLETSAVLEEIIVDTYDDDVDVGGAVFWNPVILTDTADVGFTWGDSNGLPGYNSVTNDNPALVEFQAKSAPPTKGIGIGESLVVQFDTSLADGPDRTADYLAFFNGGSDTADYTIGFHAISASTVNGESLSGIIPEPGTMLLAGFGVLLLLVRRARR